jgi:hypothetical protein
MRIIGLLGLLYGLTVLNHYGFYLWVIYTEIRKADAKNYGENAKK